jgi:ABC-type branched-subunit amino acid transport system substrate-binding protein
MAGDGFMPPSYVVELAGEAAEGLYVASPELPPEAVELTADGERFVRGFGDDAHESFALQSAQATETVLAAIARSDGTRASVLGELRATEESDGLFGHFRFDRFGDVTPGRITILRVTADVPPDERVPGLENAVAERVIEVPTD